MCIEKGQKMTLKMSTYLKKLNTLMFHSNACSIKTLMDFERQEYTNPLETYSSELRGINRNILSKSFIWCLHTGELRKAGCLCSGGIKIFMKIGVWLLLPKAVARLFIDSYPSKVMDVVDQLLRTCFEVEVDPFVSKRTTSKRLAPMNRLLD